MGTLKKASEMHDPGVPDRKDVVQLQFDSYPAAAAAEGSMDIYNHMRSVREKLARLPLHVVECLDAGPKPPLNPLDPW